MTPAQIKRRHQMIKANMLKWRNKEKELQESCSHPNLVSKGHSDTGNWDRSQDSFWYQHNCPDCEKAWVEHDDE